MNIYLDNNKLNIYKNRNLDRIITTVNFLLEKGGKVIYDIYLNGERIEELEEMEAVEIKELEIYSKKPKYILLEALQDMQEYMKKFNNVMKNMLEDGLEFNSETTLATIFDGIEGLEWVKAILSSVEELSYVKLSEFNVENEFNLFSNLLDNILDSIDNKEYYNLQYFLENELLERTKNIEEILPLVYSEILKESDYFN